MELTEPATQVPEQNAKPPQEALRLIVEVFHDGYRAAADLRSTATRLTPGQLQLELEAIEEIMLSQISMICETYHVQETLLPRN
jgi:hypothetical protein